MDKNQIKTLFVKRLTDEEQKYQAIADKAREDAISGEAKQEAKYDTRAIEASYLAGSLARRKEEITLARQEIENLETREQSQVGVGALVEIEENEDIQCFYMTESVGGYEISYGDQTIRTLSLTSGLGRSLVEASAGEDLEFQTPKGVREISVISVY